MTAESLGRVISDEDSPNHIRFRFQLRINNDVEAGQFVAIKGNRQFLGQITKPWTYNPAFADPRLIQFHERGGPDIKALYPNEEWTTAEALIVGEIIDGSLDITGGHPKPGDNVELADSETLERFFSSGNEVLLGEIHSHDNAKVRLAKDEFFDHTLISGKTGSGKTYTGAVLIESALEAGLPVVAIDPHGELGKLSIPNRNNKEIARLDRFGLKPQGYQTRLFAPSEYASNEVEKLTVTAGELSFSDLLALVGLPGDIQQMILLRSIQNLTSKYGGGYDLEQLIDEVRRYGASIRREESAETTCLRLQSLADYGILGEGVRPQDLVKENTVTILTLPGVDDFMQQIAVSILARKLLRSRQYGEVPPFLFYVEEAYLFAPNRESPPSKDPLVKLVRQGRKFGLAVVLSTQQPSNVDSRIYAQCHLKVILRLDAFSDLKFVTPWLGPQASSYTQMLPSFPDGRALVSSKSLKRPLIVDIRPRKSEHGGRTASMNPVQPRVQKMESGAIPQPAMVEAGSEDSENDRPLTEIIADLLPDDLDSLHIANASDGSTRIRTKRWIEKDSWVRINNVLSTIGFEWTSQGHASAWISKRKSFK